MIRNLLVLLQQLGTARRELHRSRWELLIFVVVVAGGSVVAGAGAMYAYVAKRAAVCSYWNPDRNSAQQASSGKVIFSKMEARCISYIANGYARRVTPEDNRYGKSEVRFFNPTQFPTRIDVTLYFADRPPLPLETVTLNPFNNGMMLRLPGILPEIFETHHAWGAKIASDTPVIVDHILAAGVDTGALRWRGGVADLLAESKASKVWYFGDGLELAKDPEKEHVLPFNEVEWYHILNPGPRPAEVTMRCFYLNGSQQDFGFHVDAERVKILSNEGLVQANTGYGIKFFSTEPVVVQGERFIRGIKSVEEWGMHIHMSRPGIPAPLEFNEAQ